MMISFKSSNGLHSARDKRKLSRQESESYDLIRSSRCLNWDSLDGSVCPQLQHLFTNRPSLNCCISVRNELSEDLPSRKFIIASIGHGLCYRDNPFESLNAFVKCDSEATICDKHIQILCLPSTKTTTEEWNTPMSSTGPAVMTSPSWNFPGSSRASVYRTKSSGRSVQLTMVSNLDCGTRSGRETFGRKHCA